MRFLILKRAGHLKQFPNAVEEMMSRHRRSLALRRPAHVHLHRHPDRPPVVTDIAVLSVRGASVPRRFLADLLLLHLRQAITLGIQYTPTL